MKQTLTLPFGGEVKEQDIYMPISAMRTHAAGIETLFEWMTGNWDELARRLPAGLSMLGTMVQLCTASFTTEKDMKRVEAFFKERSTKGFDRGLAQSLDAIRAKSAWLDRDGEDVAKWVEENGYKGKGGKSAL